MNPQAVPGSANIRLQDTREIKCPTCEGIFFKEVMMLRKAPALLTGQGRDALVPIPIMRCDDCGDIIPETVPPGLDLGRTQSENDSPIITQ